MDILIIGAGAAGIAAARTLQDAGHHPLILEARDRIGGRVFTRYDFAEFPVELGGEFIHGESTITRTWLREAGLSDIPIPRYTNLWWANPDIGITKALPPDQLPADERRIVLAILAAWRALLDKADAYRDHDRSLASYLYEIGMDAKAIHIADILLAQTCCAPVGDLSCQDLIREMQVDHAGKDEFRIREGYFALFDHLLRGINVVLNTRITKIQHSGAKVIAYAADGTIYTADHCIVTLPVSVLQAGGIMFDPPLSDRKQHAIAAFKTERATKLIYRFRERVWDQSLIFLAHPGLATRWWTPSYGREKDGINDAVISAFVTVTPAARIDEMSEPAALAHGLGELAALLGDGCTQARLESLVTDAMRVSWGDDPFARGGYAYIPVGKASARIDLAAPEGDHLFFAGEATAHDTNPQTVHGAFESGIRAAKDAMREQK